MAEKTPASGFVLDITNIPSQIGLMHPNHIYWVHADDLDDAWRLAVHVRPQVPDIV